LLPGEGFGQLLSARIVDATAPQVESFNGPVLGQGFSQQADVLRCQAVAAAAAEGVSMRASITSQSNALPQV
jgi:hypothetical protein